MKFFSTTDVSNRSYKNEFLQFEERDPCYTWLFPLALGDFNPKSTWSKPRLPRLVNNLTLYVHIPFCKFICSMCPFTHEPFNIRDMSAYVEALCKEIRFYSNFENISNRPVSTLYFGGGTASTLTPKQLEQIMAELLNCYNITSDTQITLECHPRTVNKDYLEQVRELGINRVSFGIQSFSQKNIDSLKLHQDVEQSKSILTDALSVGFKTVAMDLMFRYAGQDVNSLEEELNTVFSIGVQGISTYALDPELRNLRSVAEKQESVAIEGEMYYYLHDRLHEEGFVHVAQPDYALPGHENLQLRDLWGAPQAENLSFGAGAFSESFNGTTWANLHDSDLYVELIEKDEIPILIGQKHSWDDAVSRYPALGVRCLSFQTGPFFENFGVSFHDLYRMEISVLLNKGWIEVNNTSLTVTTKGKFFIDNISKTFFNPRNRGKSQLWAVQLNQLKPRKTWSQKQILEFYEKELVKKNIT